MVRQPQHIHRVCHLDIFKPKLTFTLGLLEKDSKEMHSSLFRGGGCSRGWLNLPLSCMRNKCGCLDDRYVLGSEHRGGFDEQRGKLSWSKQRGDQRFGCTINCTMVA
jgi:hypothetical protein